MCGDAPIPEEFYHHSKLVGVAGGVRAAAVVSADAVDAAAKIRRDAAALRRRYRAARRRGLRRSVIGRDRRRATPRASRPRECATSGLPPRRAPPPQRPAHALPRASTATAGASLHRRGGARSAARRPRRRRSPPRPPPPTSSCPLLPMPRDLDRRARARRLGLHVASGEENLLSIENDPRYMEESILVHEFGHTVMNGHDDLAARWRAAATTMR